MIRELEQAICKAGSDNHQFFGGTWTGGYFIQQDPKEFAQLVEFLQGFKIKDYLAIGIAAGGVERFIMENVSIETILVIDDGKHPNHTGWTENRKAISTLARVSPRRVDVSAQDFIGDSHSKAARKYLENFTHFDLVGIDGDHSPQGVLQDWEMVQPYLAPEGLVWFHDISISDAGQTGARKLWSRLKTQYDVLLETKGKFGIGVLRVA